jgi:hypothetical protein
VKKNLLLAGTLAAVVLAAGLGWVAGRNIQSPAEIAAAALPPEPSLITVAVERTELSADVITRADIGYDQPASITLSGALGGAPTVLIVTAAPEVGSELVEGAAAIEVSGRPVFVLAGEIPVYRDLRPGAAGIDVLQLEEALARLGHFGAVPDETWDDETGAAVAAWYESAGYPANGVSDDEEAMLDAARDRVTAAGQSVADAQQALGELQEGPTSIELLQAQAAVTGAEEDLRLAEIAAGQSFAAAQEAVIAAEFARDRAASAYSIAEARWLSAQTGVHPDTGSIPTPIEFEQLRLAYQEAGEALRLADLAIDAAITNQEVGAIQTDSALRSAQDAVTIASSQMAALTAPPATGPLARQMTAAQEELAAARRDLGVLQAAAGTWIPAGELVFLRRLPVRIDQLAVARGGRVDGSLMTVTGSDLAIRGAVSTRDFPLITEGSEVEIEDPSLPAPILGVIRLIEPQAGTRGVGADRHYIEIVSEDIPEDLIGANVRITIPVGGTAGPVLAVPVAALSASADGSTRVEVAMGNGETRFVTVEPGLSAIGLVEVTPLEGQLVEGDRVVVGYAAAG